MANTKSAERRMRSNERRRLRNRSVKSRLTRLEKAYLDAVASNKKDEAGKALREVSSAFDKAAKAGVMHRSAANRKKSRFALRLNKMK